MYAAPGWAGAGGGGVWPICKRPNWSSNVYAEVASGYRSELCTPHLQQQHLQQQQLQQQQLQQQQLQPQHLQHQPQLHLQQYQLHPKQQQQQSAQQQYIQQQQYFQQQNFQHGKHERYPYPPYGVSQSAPMSPRAASAGAAVSFVDDTTMTRSPLTKAARRPRREPADELLEEEKDSTLSDDSSAVNARAPSQTSEDYDNRASRGAKSATTGTETALTKIVKKTTPSSASGVRETDTMVLFWMSSCTFSQWAPSQFVVDDRTYCSVGQYMMASKAALFDDEDILAAILKSGDPEDLKALGRQVSNCNQMTWDRVKKQFALMGNYQKFSQNRAMCEELVATGNKVIVAANRRDTVRGIGMDASDPKTKRRESWRGLNLLGEALMRVREIILLEKPEYSQDFVEAVISSRARFAGDPSVPAVVNGVIVWL